MSYDEINTGYDDSDPKVQRTAADIRSRLDELEAGQGKEVSVDALRAALFAAKPEDPMHFHHYIQINCDGRKTCKCGKVLPQL